MDEFCGPLEFQQGVVNHETRSDVFASPEKRSTALVRVQSELDIKLQENDETAAATLLTDAASVVR